MIADESLIRYLDGELDPEARATIDTALKEDPALNARLRRLRDSSEQVRTAFAATLDEPVPERLVAEAAGGQVIAFPRRTPPPGARLWWSRAAIAASVLVGVFIGQSTGRPMVGSDLSTRGALTSALNDQPSSDTGSRVRVALSFRSSEGPYCRAFSLAKERTAGLACRTPTGWRVRMMAPDTGAASGEYRMAASALPAPVLALAQSLASGPALDARGERAAIANRWK